MQKPTQTIGVFVLGPLDRSPRMLNHAISLADFTKLKVDFIGYRGSSMPKKLENVKVNLVYIDTTIIDYLKKMPRIFYLVYAILRILIQIVQLFYILVKGNYDHILVQNPPCVPILMVIVVYRWLQIVFCRS